jgi:hypothetical protein
MHRNKYTYLSHDSGPLPPKPLEGCGKGEGEGCAESKRSWCCNPSGIPTAVQGSSGSEAHWVAVLQVTQVIGTLSISCHNNLHRAAGTLPHTKTYSHGSHRMCCNLGDRAAKPSSLKRAPERGAPDDEDDPAERTIQKCGLDLIIACFDPIRCGAVGSNPIYTTADCRVVFLPCR